MASLRETVIGFEWISHEVLWSAMRLRIAFIMRSASNLIECPAGRYTALWLLKRVTEAFDLRSKPRPYEMAKFFIIVFRIMFAAGAVVLG